MILDDLAQVVYSPAKLFKKVIENPKYLSAIIILILFIAVAVGYEFVQFSKTYTENTAPTVDQLPKCINSTYWQTSSNVTITNNYSDFFNYSIYVAALGTSPTTGYYSVFGNSSLEMDAANTNNATAALSNVFNVDCNAPSGFQNLSMTIKQVQPTVAPQSVTLTLFSINDSNFYQYDLTDSLSNSIGLWNNITVPVGPNAQGWTSSGSPSWGNVTSLQLSFKYPASESNVTIRIGALFFRGQYQTPIQYNSTGLLLQFLQVFSLQFILGWFLLTGLIYLFFKGLKAGVLWKPLFIALAFALFVMVIRAAVNLVAAATLPTLYYPYDISLGVRFDTYGTLYYPSEAVGALTSQSHAIFNSINSATSTFRFVTSSMFIIAYVWLGILCTLIVGTLKPEFSMMKRALISGASIAISILLLLLLVGVV